MDDTKEPATPGQMLKDIDAIAAAGKAAKEDIPWPAQAREAFRRIHSRFVARGYAYCHRTVAGRLPREMSLKEFVDRVFERLARDLHRLRLPPAPTVEDMERLFLTYFHKQAEWTLGDLLRSDDQDEVPPDFLEIVRSRGRWRDQVPTDEYLHNRDRLRELLTGMGSKDEDVLLTSFNYIDLETGRFTLPREERDRLCRTWDFKDPNALVQYRKRKIAELRHTLGVA